MARWALVSGPKGSDKGGLLLAISRALRERGRKVAGFVQRPREDERGHGHDLVFLSAEDVVSLGRAGSVAKDGQEAFCSFVFDLDSFAMAERRLREEGAAADVLVIEEVSKLEVAGRGHREAIAWALGRPAHVIVILGVRADQLFSVVEALGLEDAVATLETGSDEATIADFVSALA